jgi:predicted enzyme related to lactoylglutathione lyase
MSFTLTVAHVECITPILHVADMAASLKFYVGGLGFTNAPWGTEAFTAVSRDGAQLYLSRCAEGQGKERGGAAVWVGVSDVDKLRLEFSGRGVAILKEPEDLPWAREMQVADPDGNILRLGAAPRK